MKRTKKPILINFIGGPGTGKSLMAALLFVTLKKENYTVEYVQEYAKELVWKKQFKKLRNQYNVAIKQTRLNYMISKECKIIITDGPIIHNIYYAKYVHNSKNKKKIKKLVLKEQKDFKVINIFLTRNPKNTYEQSGRMQNKKEAQAIDKKMIKILKKNNINYISYLSDTKNIKKIMVDIKKVL